MKAMDEIRFHNPELQKKFETRIQQLQYIANSPNVTTQVLWDKSVQHYSDNITRVQSLLSQDELKKDFSRDLQRQMDIFLEKCTQPEFHIALVGVIKAGKSSLINAMLGENLASTDVTPETAALTRFRKSDNCDAVDVTFYTQDEWKNLWESASKDLDSKFMQEYRRLNAGQERNRWIGAQPIHVQCQTKEDLRQEIQKWTSSQSATHYFVKDVTVSLAEFLLPEGIVLVDTPGLNDSVAYRSEITANYIDRANAVLVCVKADKLTGYDLSTLNGVFSNTRYRAEKVFVIATQQDSLNNPIGDWKKLQSDWLASLRENQYFGDKQLAESNLIVTSGLLYTLIKNVDSLTEHEKNQLFGTTYKLDILPAEVASKLDWLLDFSGIDRLKRILKERIVDKYTELLLEDIRGSYNLCREKILDLVRDVGERQRQIIDAASMETEKLQEVQRESEEALKKAKEDKAKFEKLASDIELETMQSKEKLIDEIRSLGEKK